MKTVMMLAVNFPPAGGVGVMRTLKFSKYLPAFGWRPIVVTPYAGSKHIHDDSLIKEVSDKTVVHRPAFFDYQNQLPKLIGKLFRPIEKRVYFPDKYIHWNQAALRYIAQHIIPAQKIDLIYTSVGPYSTLLLAHELKKKYQIPTVVDFRDPFSFNQYAVLDQKRTFRKKARQIEKKVFQSADHINNVSEIWKQKYEALYPEIESKSSLIPNGYDEEDFVDLGLKNKNTKFTIGYSGTFSRVVPIAPLMSAIIEIHQRHNIAINLDIATPIKKERLTARYAYLFQNNLINYRGFLHHQESLKNIYQADISALILDDHEATEGMLPAKTFEYLRLANPILLLHRKKSFLAEIIAKTKTGLTVNISDQKEIVRALLMLHEKWLEKTNDYHPDWDEIKKYERKSLTQQLAEIFNRLVSD